MQVSKAVEMLEHAVEVRKSLEADHPDRLASQHELAIAYDAIERISEEVKLLEDVVKMRETLPGNHPSRVISQYALVDAYLANGCNEQVEEWLRVIQHSESREDSEDD